MVISKITFKNGADMAKKESNFKLLLSYYKKWRQGTNWIEKKIKEGRKIEDMEKDWSDLKKTIELSGYGIYTNLSDSEKEKFWNIDIEV